MGANMRHLAVDLDGVLGKFTDSYAALITKHTGLTFPPQSDEWPTEWYWERSAGLTREQEEKVWQEILQEGSTFWQKLAPMPEAKDTITQLNHLAKTTCDVYFLTNRMGSQAKYQTEKWLYQGGMDYPTVVLVADKLPVIRALSIDFFIDDKLETIQDTARAATEDKLPVRGHIYLKDAPYNRGQAITDVKDVRVVKTVREALELEGLWG